MAQQPTLPLAVLLAALVQSALAVEAASEACTTGAALGAPAAARACPAESAGPARAAVGAAVAARGADGDRDDLSALQKAAGLRSSPAASAAAAPAAASSPAAASLAAASSQTAAPLAAASSRAAAAWPGAAGVAHGAHPVVRSWSEPPEAAGSSREVLQLGRWGHVSQLLPIVVIGVFGLKKIAEVFQQSASTFSSAGLAEVPFALALYCVSGPAVILLNKHIMKDYGFHFPVLLASLGNVFLMIATRFAVALGWKRLEIDHLDWNQYFKIVVPMNVLNFLSQALGMAAYEFISVPEVQVLKSTTIVMVCLFSWLLADEEINKALLCSILCIAAGVGLSAMTCSEAKAGGGSSPRTLVGVALMVLASSSEAAKTVMSQLLVRSMPLFDGIYHSGPSFAILAAAVVCCTEGAGLARFAYSSAVLGCLVASALTTGVVVLSGFWLVKLAGALTLKVVTQARSIGLILCSVTFFGEFCTGPQYLGYTISLIGMGIFDNAKQALKNAAGGDVAKDTQRS